MPRQIQDFSVCPGNVPLRQWLRHTFTLWQGLWFGFLTVDPLILLVLFCFLITHLNGRNRWQYFSRWSPCFDFSGCPGYNRGKHYPTLEKTSAQNITACENQGKQRELSDHWNLKKNKKRFFFKKQWITQKTQKNWLKYKF